MTLPARLASRAIDGAAIAAFVGMFACVLAQVVFRYFLGDPLVWSDELARYLFVWCAFLGWVIAARRRSHLAVSLVEPRLTVRGGAALALFGALVAIVFAAILAFYGVRIAERNLDVSTTTLFFSFGVVYAIVPLAAVAVGWHALVDARRAVAALLGNGSRSAAR